MEFQSFLYGCMVSKSGGISLVTDTVNSFNPSYMDTWSVLKPFSFSSDKGGVENF